VGCYVSAILAGCTAVLCLKNDTDVAHYNFKAYQPILVIFGTEYAIEW